MPKIKPGTILPTDKEDREATRHATEDGTLLTDEQLKEMKPISQFPELQFLTKRGRPKKKHPKKQVTIRLDPEILEFFKSRGGKWQTQINAVLKDHIQGHHI